MRGPQFDSSEDGKDVLATVHGISRAMIDKMFNKTDEVDLDVVRECLKIEILFVHLPLVIADDFVEGNLGISEPLENADAPIHVGKTRVAGIEQVTGVTASTSWSMAYSMACSNASAKSSLLMSLPYCRSLTNL